MSESKTPRTDSNEAHCREYSHSNFWVVSSDLAKELEAENAKLKSAVEELSGLLEETREYNAIACPTCEWDLHFSDRVRETLKQMKATEVSHD